MNFVYIDSVLWKTFRDHAKQDFPHECIGFFEAEKVGPGSIRIIKVFPGRNAIKRKHQRTTSGLLDKKSTRELIKLDKKNKDKIYGMYHSHPKTGTVDMKGKDSFLGKVYKRFKHQLIIGVYRKGKRFRMAFWFYEKPKWHEVEIIRRSLKK